MPGAGVLLQRIWQMDLIDPREESGSEGPESTLGLIDFSALLPFESKNSATELWVKLRGEQD